MSLVRYRANDYSVPVEWGHREVLVKGFVQEVVICAASEVIARHPRSYEREDMIFDPVHYLALLEQKPGALDQAAPLQSWNLPEEFQRIRRLLESRMGNRGKKEFIQILRLLEVFEEAIVAAFAGRIEYAQTTYVDHKTELQEAAARLGHSVTYTVLDVDGRPHDRTFTCAAVLDGEEAGVGKGPSKKVAEQEAAREALAKLGVQPT